MKLMHASLYSCTLSRPHSRFIAIGCDSIIESTVRSVGDHRSTGPSVVAPQSTAAMSLPISLPAPNTASAARRAAVGSGRPAPTTWSSISGSSPSGTTRFASPPSITAEGIPNAAEVASSWAITVPPPSRTDRHPAAPSRPVPVSTTASTPGPCETAADENSSSTDPADVLRDRRTVSVPSGSRRTVDRPGHRYTRPGSASAPSSAQTTGEQDTRPSTRSSLLIVGP